MARWSIGHALRGFELNWLVRESTEQIELYLDELINVLFYGVVSEERLVRNSCGLKKRRPF